METLEKFNERRKQSWELQESENNIPKLNGISCPRCGAELFDTEPAYTLMSNPPKKNIHCSECEFKGYRIA